MTDREFFGDDPKDVMGDVFAILVGEARGLIEGEEVRSAPGTPTCDVYVRGAWYRLLMTEVAQPITLEEHDAD